MNNKIYVDFDDHSGCDISFECRACGEIKNDIPDLIFKIDELINLLEKFKQEHAYCKDVK